MTDRLNSLSMLTENSFKQTWLDRFHKCWNDLIKVWFQFICALVLCWLDPILENLLHDATHFRLGLESAYFVKSQFVNHYINDRWTYVVAIQKHVIIVLFLVAWRQLTAEICWITAWTAEWSHKPYEAVVITTYWKVNAWFSFALHLFRDYR